LFDTPRLREAVTIAQTNKQTFTYHAHAVPGGETGVSVNLENSLRVGNAVTLVTLEATASIVTCTGLIPISD
jgi:hypothetical protein